MTILNNILRRKANWIGGILRRNCLLHDDIEDDVSERARRTQLLDDLQNRRTYWERKEEAEDKTRVYQSNIRKKYKLSSISPWTY